MKILLIWNEIPDCITGFILEEGTEEANLAINSSDKFINSDDLEEDDDIFALEEWIQNNRHRGVEQKGPIEGPFSKVIICGFVM